MGRFDIPPSHFGKDRSVVFEVGQTQKTGDDLSEVLKPYFQQDSYDLVCKNCNSFTDCALAFLLSRRLPKKYSMTESLGKDLPRITPYSQMVDISRILRLRSLIWTKLCCMLTLMPGWALHRHSVNSLMHL